MVIGDYLNKGHGSRSAAPLKTGRLQGISIEPLPRSLQKRLGRGSHEAHSARDPVVVLPPVGGAGSGRGQ